MRFLKQLFSEILQDNCTTLAASISFYTLFALAPMLYLLVLIVSFGLSAAYPTDEAEKHAKEFIVLETAEILGNQSIADEIGRILEGIKNNEHKLSQSILSFVGILFGATGVVAALQTALNQVWQVRVNPKRHVFLIVLRQRLLSFGMILALGFLLLVSLVVSSAVALASKEIGTIFGFQDTLTLAMNYVVQACVIFTIFAAIFRIMPDAIVHMRDVAIGAAITTALFLTGRYVLQIYFTTIKPGAQLGAAAGSIVAILLWVYYSSFTALLGAELTQILAMRGGRGITPEKYAVRVFEKIESIQ